MDIVAGQLSPLGEITVPLSRIRKATKLTLELALEGSRNQWPVWIYPPPDSKAEPDNVVVTRHLDEAALAALKQGGRVLWLAHGTKHRDIAKTKFASVFWSAGWWGNRFSSLGILCDPTHPALAQFPNDGHSDWQWHELTEGAATFDLTTKAPNLQPIVQPVADFHFNHRLAHLFETRVGPGRLMVCGYNLSDALDTRHAARQFRLSLLHYMAGHEFQPNHHWPNIADHFPLPLMGQLGAAVQSCSSYNRGFEPARAIDGDPSTMWHTQWQGEAPGFPHEIVISFPETLSLAGLTLLPRQDGNPNGWIRTYAVHSSVDGQQWTEAVAQGQLDQTKNLKAVRFSQPVRARLLKLRVLSPFDHQPFASLAELEVILAKQK
jgi:hypothetical protein